MSLCCYGLIESNKEKRYLVALDFYAFGGGFEYVPFGGKGQSRPFGIKVIKGRAAFGLIIL